MKNIKPEILAFSGIRYHLPNDVFFRKLNFQNLDNVRNLAEFKFGRFGVIILAKNALLGSLKQDWGSVNFEKKLDLSN